jgi:glycine reductase
MMEKKIRVIHYVNPTFAGLPKTEGDQIVLQLGSTRLGQELEKISGGKIEIEATVIGDDNYVAENLKEATEEIVSLLYNEDDHDLEVSFDLFIAGPAFNAGRYGMACGALCRAVQERLGIPAVTAMYKENPGVDQYRKSVCIVETPKIATNMKDVLEKMVSLGLKLLRGEEVDRGANYCFIRGIRQNYWADKTGAERAIDALLAETVATEYPMPEFDRVSPVLMIEDVTKTTVALVTSGGIVPRGNPDKIEASSAQKFGEYLIDKSVGISAQTHETAHGGYDGTYANAQPNRVLPVDVLLDLEKDGKIGKLHEKYYATVGNGTSVGNARKYGQEIAKRLVADGVQMVILTST